MTKRFALGLFTLCLLTGFSGPAFAVDGDSFTSMSNPGLTATADGLQSRTSTVTASLIFFTDRATFEAAAPGLTLEDFNNGNVGPGGVVGCGDPLVNGDPCFAPDGIEDGISLRSSSASSFRSSFF